MRRRAMCGGCCTHHRRPARRFRASSSIRRAGSRSSTKATKPGRGWFGRVFDVPRYLLSGGKARSWETVTEARINELSRYVAIAKPLWSRAEGYHRLDEQPDGTTLLTFHEEYHAYNPVVRSLLERRVHHKISTDNMSTYEHALSFVGTTRLVSWTTS